MRNQNLKKLLIDNPALLAGTNIDPMTAKQSISRQFVRRRVSLAGVMKLVDPVIDKQPGVTSLDKGKIAGNQAFLITEIGLRYAFHASDPNVFGKRYVNNIYDIIDVVADPTDQDAGAAGVQSSPVAAQIVHQNLLDATFKLNIDGNVRVELQANDFFIENTVNEKLRSDADYFVSLETSPILLLPNKIVDAELEVHPSLAAPANNHFVELVLGGVLLF